MKRIKKFTDFLKEDVNNALRLGGTELLGMLKGIPPAGANQPADDGDPITIGGSTPVVQMPITTPLTTVPGNDDFTLYMQHQQGIAGAKGLIQASQGTGKLASDTIKTKSGTKYANLVMNIPSDRPQVKADLIKALDAGDQKTAALLFLNMWKEKWASKSKQAQTLINDSRNAAVKQAIAKYAQQYGVPFDFAATVANIESSFNPNSGNSRYKGLFALSSEEFNRYVPGGNIHNIDNNANAGIQCLRNNIKEFKKYLGPTLATLKLGSWANNIA